MSEKNVGSSAVQEIIELKEKFEKIKAETEEFVASAKHLSDTGLHEAKELIEAAKSNWQSIVSSFSGMNMSNLFGKAKGAEKKAKKVVKAVKKKSKAKRK